MEEKISNLIEHKKDLLELFKQERIRFEESENIYNIQIRLVVEFISELKNILQNKNLIQDIFSKYTTKYKTTTFNLVEYLWYSENVQTKEIEEYEIYTKFFLIFIKDLINIVKK